ncbi:MAG: hypothetical protein HRU18_11140 [Pseudoalteromonas sp.]|uniref:hypothetical protein n=1 Tax=Pseudoalteromonas sp. TaxID=53249 RepID=UPI001D961D8A|nr:hypothetical protein [Pseudoalteromonas sp.]NRA78754.1 hypothetical protein [Pseudoalteromonas sp.]
MSKLSERLDKLGQEFKTRLERTARTDKTVATGAFASSFKVREIKNGFEIINNTGYAEAVIDGTSPSKSSRDYKGKLNRLEKWMRAKGIRPYRKLSGGGVKFARTSTEMQSALRSALFSVSKSISERGIIKRFGYKGSNLTSRIYKEMENKFNLEITDAVREDLIGEIRETIKSTQK